MILNASGWLSLLPYIEQQALYQKWNPRGCVSTQNTTYCCSYTASGGTLVGDPVANGNYLVVSQRLDVFRCPSDPGDDRLYGGGAYGISDSSPVPGIMTDYDFSASTGDFSCNWWKTAATASRPLFGQNSNARFQDITDGTSNTVAVIETLHSVSNGTCPAWGYRAWVHIGIDFSIPINSWYVNAGVATVGKLASWGYPASMHPGGCQVLLADGSARFFSQTNLLSTQTVLRTIAGGESPPTW